MSNISAWSTSAASNNAAAPNGAPEGWAPSSVNNWGRETMAAVARWYGDTKGNLVTAGTSSAYTLTTNSSFSALANLSLLAAEIHTDNTGACTLAVDGLTAKSIKLPGGADPAAGALKAGSIVLFGYESDADVFIAVGGVTLGTAAGLNTGTASGDVPVLGGGGALSSGVYGAAVPVGTPVATFSSTPDSGFLMLNGDTIGNASSGATHDSADYEALFAKMWNSVSNTYAAVSGGRGASAAADWAANKTLTLPNAVNRGLFGSGDTYEAGETGGAATVTLTTDEIPAHTHTITKTGRFGSNEGGTVGWGKDVGSAGNFEFTVDAAGGGSAHENMPPFLAVYWQVRY